MILSACLLARNEAPRIGRAIKSIRQHVQEVVVLDTGSDDDTMEVARGAGADVIISEPERTVDLGDGFRSLGDFAAARNRVMGAASGDFLLVVDADHIFVPPTFLAIREAMKRDHICAAALLYHIATSQKAKPLDVVTGKKRIGQPHQSPALLRAHKTDREYYYGIIHEVPTAWEERRIAEGMKHGVLRDSRIADYGHEPGIRAAIGKDERNRRLLELAIKRTPDDPVPYTYLAAMYLATGDEDRCENLCADVYPKIGKDTRLAGSHLLRLCATMGLLWFRRGVPDLAWQSARIWEQHDGRAHPDVDLVKGLACELWGKTEEAKVFYRASTTRSADAVGSQHILNNIAGERLAVLGAGKPLVMAG